MTQSYEVYGGGSEGDVPWELRQDSPTPAGAGPWQVAVEYAAAVQDRPATVVQIDGEQHASRDDALVAAQRAAFEFDPPDPFAPQSRQVFRDGPDGYLVVIHGAMSTWHMSVRVVQHVGDA